MLKTNYHTHTYRCGHATGTDEEYVRAAIEAGVKVLGFSDHAAYPPSDPRGRMNIEQVDEYCSSILSLKEKYKDQITIYLGMEVECYKEYWDVLAGYRKRFDYCILGQHHIGELNSPSVYSTTTAEALQTYVDSIAYACEHRLCDYICHPDVCLWTYPRIDDSVRSAAKDLAQISLKYDIPLEINCGSGVLHDEKHYEDGDRFAYPTRAFFEEFAEQGCKTIIGLDIHKPELFLTDKYLDRALSVVKDLPLTILEDYDLPAAAIHNKQLFY